MTGRLQASLLHSAFGGRQAGVMGLAIGRHQRLGIIELQAVVAAFLDAGLCLILGTPLCWAAETGHVGLAHHGLTRKAGGFRRDSRARRRLLHPGVDPIATGESQGNGQQD
ncbi:hypothetical protein [Halomonas sp.]|uniref:hypothetical protein n=1 Tax=Halomonas sp. TaxID=1486246 RepID=UPI00356555E4